MEQLGDLQRHLQEIRALQAEIIAVASRGREDVQKTQAALKIEYSLVPGPLPGLFKQYKAYNDEKKVALPTTVIIDRNGVLRWQHVGKDENDRVNGATVLAQLRKL